MSRSTGNPTVEEVYEALDTVKDPCMGAAGLDLSIVDLGLVYGVDVDDGTVKIEMTFTEIGCIFTHVIGAEVYDAVGMLPGVEHVEVTPRWLPIWTEDRLNGKASHALASNRDAMFQAMKSRGLQSAASGRGHFNSE